MKRTAMILAILTCSFVMNLATANAAIAPHTPKELEKLASMIVVGKSLEVSSKIREYRTSAGELYRDKVFTTTIKVEKVTKGAGIKVGDIITVENWTTHTRPKGLNGWQGLDHLPKEKQRYRLYLKAKKGKAFVPVFPNGMTLAK